MAPLLHLMIYVYMFRFIITFASCFSYKVKPKVQNGRLNLPHPRPLILRIPCDEKKGADEALDG